MDVSFTSPMWTAGSYGCPCTIFTNATFTMGYVSGAAINGHCVRGGPTCPGGGGLSGNTSGVCGQMWSYHDDNWCPTPTGGSGALTIDICFSLWCNYVGDLTVCGARLVLDVQRPSDLREFDSAIWGINPPNLSQGLDLNSYTFTLPYLTAFSATIFPCSGSDVSHGGSTPLGTCTVVKH
jgi:hypothetical protein